MNSFERNIFGHMCTCQQLQFQKDNHFCNTYYRYIYHLGHYYCIRMLKDLLYTYNKKNNNDYKNQSHNDVDVMRF